jgi:hypothetical protein
MKNKIVKALFKELETAKEKEDKLFVEYKNNSKTYSVSQLAEKWAEVNEASGYTNGILEALSIINRETL